MAIYMHFLEDDFWYAYEAFANISIAMVPGLILMLYVLWQHFWPTKYFIKNFVFVCSTPFLLICTFVYTAVLLIMFFEAKATYMQHEEIHTGFTKFFYEKGNHKE